MVAPPSGEVAAITLGFCTLIREALTVLESTDNTCTEGMAVSLLVDCTDCPKLKVAALVLCVTGDTAAENPG